MCVEADGEHGCGEADAQDLEDMEKKREDHVEKHPTNVFQAQAICAVDPFQATLSRPQKKTGSEIPVGRFELVVFSLRVCAAFATTMQTLLQN